MNVKKQPDQLLYDELFKITQSLGIDVYAFLPNLEVKYPFVIIDDMQLLPSPTKNKLIGEISATIHIWTNNGNRKLVSDMVGQLLEAYSCIKKVDYLTFSMNLNSSSHIMKDNSTNEELFHGVLDVTFKFI